MRQFALIHEGLPAFHHIIVLGQAELCRTPEGKPQHGANGRPGRTQCRPHCSPGCCCRQAGRY